MGLLDGSLDGTNILLGIVFSGIGFIAYRYGRKMQLVGPIAIGVALMIYPMFVSSRAWSLAIGVGLTAGLFVFRE